MRFRTPLLSVVVVWLTACAGAPPSGPRDGDPPRASVHDAHRALSLRFEQASVAPGGFLFAALEGRVTTDDVDESGSATLRVEIVGERLAFNGAPIPVEGHAQSLTLSSPASGGVSEVALGDALGSATRLFASLLPLAWPAVERFPSGGDPPVSLALGSGRRAITLVYEPRPSAATGEAWVVVRTRSGGALSVSGVHAIRTPFDGTIATRLAFGARSASDADGSTAPAERAEIELVIAEEGRAPALPEPRAGGMLACASTVASLRARLDATAVAPFVLARPPHDALLSRVAEEARGAALLLDLDEGELARHPLYAHASEPVALDAETRDAIRALESSAVLVAELTGAARPQADGPVYLRVPHDAPASFVVDVADAIARAGRTPRLVVRRAPDGPRRELLGGGLFPFAERLVENAARCPFLAEALDGLDERAVATGPSWVRAVLAGGIGTCGCDAVLADELATDALSLTDASMQSYGFVPAPRRATDATSATGVVTLPPSSTAADLVRAIDGQASTGAIPVRFR